MAGKSTVPRYGDLITATYAALKALGGSGKKEEINEKVVELLSLPDEVLEIPHCVSVQTIPGGGEFRRYPGFQGIADNQY